jgi:hypothetical protein
VKYQKSSGSVTPGQRRACRPCRARLLLWLSMTDTLLFSDLHIRARIMS